MGGWPRGWTLTLGGWLLALQACAVGCDSSPSSWTQHSPYCWETRTRGAHDAGSGPTDAGSGRSDAGPGRSDAGSGPAELCRIISERLCDQWSRCGCHQDTGEPVGAGCVARVDAECEERLASPSVLAALERGTMVWSGPRVSAFVRELTEATASCESARLDVSRVVEGRLPPGSPCEPPTDPLGTVFSECRDGACPFVEEGPAGSPPTFCREISRAVPSPRTLGESCAFNFDCVTGARCAPVCDPEGPGGVCAPGLGPGERCRPGDCADGWRCEPDADARFYDPDRAGRCVEVGVRQVGDACRLDAVCASGFCDRHHGVYDSTHGRIFTGRCAPLLSAGDDCDSSAHCATHACREARFVELYQCEGTGESCREDHRCPRGGCLAGLKLGTCGRPAGDGTPCLDDAGCASAYCDPHRHVCGYGPPAELGASCNEIAGCMEGGCVEGTCRRDDGPAGEPCEDSSTCFSHACLAGQCESPACVSLLATTATWFGWTLSAH